MNRTILIIAGVFIILLVLSVWVYLMLFGTPKNTNEVFTNLGFNVTQQQVTITPPDATLPTETIVDTKTDALRQLTTRPIAGHIATTTQAGHTVRYVERGTGHIYEIQLETGIENVLSRTTIPQVTHAVFSPNGKTVALTSYTTYDASVFVGQLTQDLSLSGIPLQPNAKNIAFISDTEILYTVTRGGETTGYQQHLQTGTLKEKFRFNYANLDVVWGADHTETYISTKPSHDFEGFIYTITGSTPEPFLYPAHGLSALFSNAVTIATFVDNGVYVSQAHTTDGETYQLPTLALKEKCVFDVFSTQHAWCSAPLEQSKDSFVEDWYKGTVTSEDHLWLVDITQGEAALYADFQSLTGRPIDVRNITINKTGEHLLFTNKIDQTLWLYDLTTE